MAEAFLQPVTAGSRSGALVSGQGLVIRLAPIKGITPVSALAGRVYLPAHVDQLDISEQALHNEYDTLSGGHFSQPAMGGASARQFRTTTLSTLTMDWEPSWFVVTRQDPVQIRQAIAEILRAKKAVHLLGFLHPHPLDQPEFDMYCTLRQNTVSLRQGEVDTRYQSVDISEWRDPSVVRRSSSNGSRKKGVQLPTTKAITATDTLQSLSMEFYGTYEFWRDLRDLNGISPRFGQKTVLVSLPGRWKVGYKIKIGAISTQAVFTPVTA